MNDCLHGLVGKMYSDLSHGSELIAKCRSVLRRGVLLIFAISTSCSNGAQLAEMLANAKNTQ